MTEKQRAALRRSILDTAGDLMASFLYYDRKEDDDLPSPLFPGLAEALSLLAWNVA